MTNLIRKIQNRLARKTTRLDERQMWFLSCPDEEILNNKALDQESIDVFMSLRKNGFAVLKGNVDPALCDAVVADFDAYCETHPESEGFADEHGLHSRLALFHYVSENARKVCTAPRTVKILKAAFQKDFTIVGSLLFEKGSAQDIHRDTPAFFTNPLNHFFGVWNALEDIKKDSGELCYYVGGHKILPDADLYRDPSTNIKSYFSRVEQACKDAGLTRDLFLAKKGDTLIWLPELPHGGAARVDDSLTRRSIVFHYIPNGVPIHGSGYFFDSARPIFVNENYAYRTLDGIRTIDMGETRFYHNYQEGNFAEG